MAAFDYARSAATGERLIARFGQAATLIKPGAITGPGYAPTAYAADEEHAIKAIDLMFRMRDAGGTLVTATRRTLYVSTEGLTAVEPEKGDRVRVGGTVHEIDEVRPLRPGGTNVLWEVDLAHG